MRLLLVSVFGLILCLPLRAEELLAKVQRELRTRKFYFGEIDGKPTQETVDAIVKFQEVKGIYHTGQLNGETLRALGLSEAVAAENREEAQLLEECNTCVLRYLQAWQGGDWERENAFYADVVNYFEDQNVSREFIREVWTKELRRWPYRKATLLNRIASLVEGSSDQVQVTARVRMEVGAAAEQAQARIENLIFRLQKNKEGWRIAAVKLLE